MSERSISVLRRLKTYLRTTMGQERMTGLALMHTKYRMELNLDDIINIFACRMLFADISQIIYAIVHAIFMLIFLRPNWDLTSI